VAYLPSQVTLQQQMSSLGQAYSPENSLDSMTQLVPYGSTLNLPEQIEQAQSPQGDNDAPLTCSQSVKLRTERCFDVTIDSTM